MDNDSADREHELFCCYEDAVTSVRSAISALNSANDQNAKLLADALDDVLFEIKSELAIHDDALKEAERLEMEAMTQEYWRSVI